VRQTRSSIGRASFAWSGIRQKAPAGVGHAAQGLCDLGASAGRAGRFGRVGRQAKLRSLLSVMKGVATRRMGLHSVVRCGAS